ncbi:hypothetical protein Tco_1092220 [Tanacetum coccineum]|uniref:Uncharacterized protein n=1 Tax=Tanacetum coccineum TaxID=301880 RepID=A0ABQ5IB74_9ASTR
MVALRWPDFSREEERNLRFLGRERRGEKNKERLECGFQNGANGEMKRTMALQLTPNRVAIKDLKSSQQNVEKVQEHLVKEEIETMVEGTKNVDEDEFMDEIFKSPEDPDTRLEPGSHKERPEEEKSVDLMIINDEEEEESTGDALRKKWKGIVKIKDTPLSTPIRSLRTHTAPLSLDKEKL